MHHVAAAGFLERVRAFYILCTCGQEFITRVSQVPSGTGRYADELMIEWTSRNFRRHADVVNMSAVPEP